MKKLKILLADDHSMIRKGLKLLLQGQLEYQEVYEAVSCNEVMKELHSKTYTHLVLDVILSDGSSLEILPNIKKVYPDVKIIIFSMQPDEVYAKALRQYDIHYYLTKTCAEDETVSILKQFIEDDKPVRRGIRQKKEIGKNKPDNPFGALPGRELTILHYMLKGMGTKDIASALNLKMNTVSTLKNRIFERTATENLKELVELATKYNMNY